MKLFRLGSESEGHWGKHSYPAQFCIDSSGSKERIIASVPDSDTQLIASLASTLLQQGYLLYVLHTPRGEGLPGRYQSELLPMDSIRSFFDRFGTFLRSDGRYDLWIGDPDTGTTLVWDRHDLLWCYGDITRIAQFFRDRGFEVSRPSIPAPHEHHYHSELDVDAKDLLNALDWYRTDLHEADIQ